MPTVKPIVIDAGAEPRQSSSGGGGGTGGGGESTGGGLCELNGMVTAHAVASLHAQIVALRQIVSDMLSGKHSFDTVLAEEVCIMGAKPLIVGSGVPKFEPDFIGQRYIDKENKVAYVAVGNSSTGDWKPTTTPQ